MFFLFVGPLIGVFSRLNVMDIDKKEEIYNLLMEKHPFWEPLRDDHGDVVEGCFHTYPSPDSDDI